LDRASEGERRLYFEVERLVLGLALGFVEVRERAAVFRRPQRSFARTASSRAGTTLQFETVGASSDDVMGGNHREEEQGGAAAASGAAAAGISLSALPGLMLENPDLEITVQQGRSARAASTSQRRTAQS
jgi:hypothetical protein